MCVVFAYAKIQVFSRQKLNYTLTSVGTLRGYNGVMVNQSQKNSSDYRPYENTEKIKKKRVLDGLLKFIPIH